MTGLNHRLRAAGSGWTTAASFTQENTDPTWGGYTLRQLYYWADINAGSATQFRITVSNLAGVNYYTSGIYAGISVPSLEYNFTTTPVPVYFNGTQAFTMSGDSPIVSDPFSLTVGSSDNLLFSMYVSSSTSDGDLSYDDVTSTSSAYAYYKSGDYKSTVTMPSVTAVDYFMFTITKLEYK